MITTMNRAMPKPPVSNELPIMPSVNMSVTAFITNRKSPNVKTVTGNVKIIKIGRTSIFKMERVKLAPIAAPKLDT